MSLHPALGLSVPWDAVKPLHPELRPLSSLPPGLSCPLDATPEAGQRWARRASCVLSEATPGGGVWQGTGGLSSRAWFLFLHQGPFQHRTAALWSSPLITTCSTFSEPLLALLSMAEPKGCLLPSREYKRD